jgi:hypothetical protein
MRIALLRATPWLMFLAVNLHLNICAGAPANPGPTSSVAQITFGSVAELEPACSPDGQRGGWPMLCSSPLSLTTLEGAPSFLRSWVGFLSFGGRVGFK